MLSGTGRTRRGRVGGWVVLGGGAAVMVGAAVWLALTGNTGLRYSADLADTVPMWERWVAPVVGIVLIRLMPVTAPVPPADGPEGVRERRSLRVGAWTLLAAAVLFAVVLRAAGGGEPTHTVLKAVLLLAVPMVLFWTLRHGGTAWSMGSTAAGAWRRYGPAVPVAAWLVISYATPLALPPNDYGRGVGTFTLIATIVMVFVVNSLMEEFFYRRWLQTRWELIIGPWPAIMLASLLWAVWHIGIQGTGALGHDMAAAVLNQGVQGLFLGYLWTKYRMMWPLLVVHGAVNALPVLLGLG